MANMFSTSPINCPRRVNRRQGERLHAQVTHVDTAVSAESNDGRELRADTTHSMIMKTTLYRDESSQTFNLVESNI